MLSLTDFTLLHPWGASIVGGALIGFSVSMMLAFTGRITGLSGIISSVFVTPLRSMGWQRSFLVGLLLGGLTLLVILPSALGTADEMSFATLIVAGLLVGFGTRLGGGCTSGHGICGISRLSVRSMVATGIFVFIGMVTASLVRHWGLI